MEASVEGYKVRKQPKDCIPPRECTIADLTDMAPVSMVRLHVTVEVFAVAESLATGAGVAARHTGSPQQENENKQVAQ